MNFVFTRFAEPENVLDDPRLKIYQDFVSLLLWKMKELGEYKTTEDFESLHRELRAALSDSRRRFADLYGDEMFLAECGLADELLQNADWAGQEWWSKNLLELKMFHSQTIGDKFYETLERILERKRKSDLPLAIILLETLALGFHGRLTDSDVDTALWNRYRKELGEMVSKMLKPSEIAAARKEEQYASSLRSERLPEIPSLKRWCAFTVLAFVAMLLFSHFLWWKTVEPLHEMINRAAFESVDAVLVNTSVSVEGGE